MVPSDNNDAEVGDMRRVRGWLFEIFVTLFWPYLLIFYLIALIFFPKKVPIVNIEYEVTTDDMNA